MRITEGLEEVGLHCEVTEASYHLCNATERLQRATVSTRPIGNFTNAYNRTMDI